MKITRLLRGVIGRTNATNPGLRVASGHDAARRGPRAGGLGQVPRTYLRAVTFLQVEVCGAQEAIARNEVDRVPGSGDAGLLQIAPVFTDWVGSRRGAQSLERVAASCGRTRGGAYGCGDAKSVSHS